MLCVAMNQSSLLRTLADLDASRAGVEKVYNELLDWQQKLVGQDDPSKPATKLMHTMNLDHEYYIQLISMRDLLFKANERRADRGVCSGYASGSQDAKQFE